MIVKQPLVLAEVEQSFDIDIKVNGGGSFGQAGAIRLAISKALIDENAELRGLMKKAGYPVSYTHLTLPTSQYV